MNSGDSFTAYSIHPTQRTSQLWFILLYLAVAHGCAVASSLFLYSCLYDHLPNLFPKLFNPLFTPFEYAAI
jgi:hypothetical protein